MLPIGLPFTSLILTSPRSEMDTSSCCVPLPSTDTHIRGFLHQQGCKIECDFVQIILQSYSFILLVILLSVKYWGQFLKSERYNRDRVVVCPFPLSPLNSKRVWYWRILPCGVCWKTLHQLTQRMINYISNLNDTLLKARQIAVLLAPTVKQQVK